MADVTMKNEEMSLSFADLIGLFWRRIWLILLAAILVGGSCFVYNYMTYTERYTSTTKMYVLNTEVMEGASASTTAYYFQLALTVVEDCKELVLSETVLDRVIEELDLNMAPKVLRGMISVSNMKDSRILKISVTTGDPELSSRIANSVCDQGMKRVREIMNVNQMSVYEYSEVSQIPSNDVNWQMAMLLGLLAGIVVYGVCFLLMLADDKVSDVDDVEQYLGLTILGDIPHKSSGAKKRRNHAGYYGKYYGKYVGK